LVGENLHDRRFDLRIWVDRDGEDHVAKFVTDALNGAADPR
jgi:hypothetical protein